MWVGVGMCDVDKQYTDGQEMFNFSKAFSIQIKDELKSKYQHFCFILI
jgi:hypothetical protein